jgi:hypothetical protein
MASKLQTKHSKTRKKHATRARRRQIHIWLSTYEYECLKANAEANDSTASGVVRHLISVHIARRPQPRRRFTMLTQMRCTEDSLCPQGMNRQVPTSLPD